MSDLCTIIGYEYKKIMKRKSTYISLFIVLIIILLVGLSNVIGYTYVDGEKDISKYEHLKIDKEHGVSLSGREFDEKLIKEMQDAYRKLPDVERYTRTPEYEMYARPYYMIRSIVHQVSGDFMNMEPSSFYDLRNENMKAMLNNLSLTEQEVQMHIDLNKNISTPISYYYQEGYYSYASLLHVTGIFLTFALAICMANLFAGEYTSKMDQLILSSRYGKNKIILGKLITGLSFATINILLFFGLNALICLAIYGFDGGNSPYQLSNIFSTYPLTILESVVIHTICVSLTSLGIVSLTMFLSAKLKTPFAVIIIVTSYLFGSVFFQFPMEQRWLITIKNLLPTNMMADWGVFSEYTYQIGNYNILPYHFIPILCFFSISILSYLAYRGFKKHQII